MNFTRLYRSGLMAVMAFSSIFAMAATPAAAAPASQASTPAFTVGQCPFTFASSASSATPDATSSQIEGKTYKCGMVTVPEDHSKPDGKTIELAVAVFKSTAKKPAADPVIYLDGGPGGPSLMNAYGDLTGFGFQGFLDTRDLILFDQRGTGFSKPNLNCPEFAPFFYDNISVVLSPEESAKGQTALLLACQKRFAGEGINLAAYNTDQSAADVDAIRQALGYKTLNLYGISYGTLLALVTMRDFPQGVRSSVIDSVVPPEQHMEVQQIPAMERVFKELWDGCKADAGCNQAYPNLEKVFYATVDRLNKKPVTITAADPTDNKKYKVAINGYALMDTVFQSFYVTGYIPYLPQLIYAASKGKLAVIATLLLEFLSSVKDTSYGLYFSVNCRERLAYESVDQVKAAAVGDPQQMIDGQLPGLQGEFDICSAWGAGKAPTNDIQPIKSQIPTLVMAGTFDPVTPPSGSKQVADELGNAYYFEIPNSGHGASPDGGCGFSIVTSFLDAPTTKPDGSCIDSIGAPQWKTPASP